MSSSYFSVRKDKVVLACNIRAKEITEKREEMKKRHIENWAKKRKHSIWYKWNPMRVVLLGAELEQEALKSIAGFFGYPWSYIGEEDEGLIYRLTTACLAMGETEHYCLLCTYDASKINLWTTGE